MISSKFSALSRLALAGTAVLLSLGSPAASAADPVITEYHAAIAPILEKHCYECHGDGYDKGKVAFDALDTDEKILQPDLWLQVLNNTRAGLMPAEQKAPALRRRATEARTLDQVRRVQDRSAQSRIRAA